MTEVWQDVTTHVERERGEERYVRTIDEFTWISVIRRLTGFGWHSWETAIVMREEQDKKKQFRMIDGDRREELGAMPKSELVAWWETNVAGHEV